MGTGIGSVRTRFENPVRTSAIGRATARTRQLAQRGTSAAQRRRSPPGHRRGHEVRVADRAYGHSLRPRAIRTRRRNPRASPNRGRCPGTASGRAPPSVTANTIVGSHREPPDPGVWIVASAIARRAATEPVKRSRGPKPSALVEIRANRKTGHEAASASCRAVWRLGLVGVVGTRRTASGGGCGCRGRCGEDWC